MNINTNSKFAESLLLILITRKYSKGFPNKRDKIKISARMKLNLVLVNGY